MGNVEHLAQLEGDARVVAEEACRRFPGFVITSSRRDVQRQALAMASNVVRQRSWVLGDANTKATYRWSPVAALLHGWSIHPDNAAAKEHEIAAAFADIMNRQPVSELVKLSRHLAPVTAGAHAFDARPLLTAHGQAQLAAGSLEPEFTADGKAICVFLADEAKRLGGTFLTREGKIVVLHWQAKD